MACGQQKVLHVDSREVTKINDWLWSIYGKITVTGGNIHDYLGMMQTRMCQGDKDQIYWRNYQQIHRRNKLIMQLKHLIICSKS